MEYLEIPFTVTRKLLWWQKRGLQQTAAGYGSNLTTDYMLHIAGERSRRVYAVCYSNVAFAMGNSWRGDDFEPELRAIIARHETTQFGSPDFGIKQPEMEEI